MNTNAIRKKILDLAIHGKLVPQDPNDEPAAVLLERIRAEREALIKSGKIKRGRGESVLKECCDNSYYGKLPQGWALAQLDDVLYYEQPTSYIVESTDYNDSYKTPVLTAGKSFIVGHTNEINGICSELPVIIFDDFTTDSRYVDFRFKVKSSAMKILRGIGINVKYVFYYMQTIECNHSTHKRYWISDYSQKLILLPPLAEQNRIVSAIESAVTIIDEIERNKTDLRTAITAAKSKTLDLAIRGKLVQQDPTDEPADILLERILAERETLVKSGKIKRGKDESALKECCDNSYYEKISLGNVCILLNTPEIEYGTLPYLDVRYLRRGILPELKQSGRYLECGTPIILVDGENSGEVFFTHENGYMGSTFRELLILKAFDVNFVMLFIRFFQKELRENKTGSAIPHLNKKLFTELPLPLISKNRQRDIVCIIEKLFTYLDKIATNLT
ncbi:hypothetical protein R80B4_00315 [Fibrobacteres bacterium R8-0-B4]